MNINSISKANLPRKGYKSIEVRNKLTNELMEAIMEHGITKKSENIVKKVGYMIAEDWARLRKAGGIIDTPVYRVADKENFVTVKPVYQQFKNCILMEVEGDNQIDRILINRQKPSDYIYERAKVTPYGSASGKTFNSLTDKDKAIETRVNNYISNYLPKVLTNEDGTTKLTKTYHGLDY